MEKQRKAKRSGKMAAIEERQWQRKRIGNGSSKRRENGGERKEEWQWQGKRNVYSRVR
jgi:hypothetical protein